MDGAMPTQLAESTGSGAHLCCRSSLNAKAPPGSTAGAGDAALMSLVVIHGKQLMVNINEVTNIKEVTNINEVIKQYQLTHGQVDIDCLMAKYTD